MKISDGVEKTTQQSLQEAALINSDGLSGYLIGEQKKKTYYPSLNLDCYYCYNNNYYYCYYETIMLEHYSMGFHRWHKIITKTKGNTIYHCYF